MSTYLQRETIAALQALGFGDEIASGRFYMVGSGRMSLSVAGNVRALIANPAESGRIIGIAGIVVFGTATSWANIYKNPTAGLPAAAARPVTNALVGPPTEPAVVQVTADTDATVALSGGTDTGVVMGSGGGNRETVTAPFQLWPGQSLGFNVPFAGAADATLTAWVAEKDA